jgi:hypothetical protein
MHPHVFPPTKKPEAARLLCVWDSRSINVWGLVGGLIFIRRRVRLPSGWGSPSVVNVVLPCLAIAERVSQLVEKNIEGIVGGPTSRTGGGATSWKGHKFWGETRDEHHHYPSASHPAAALPGSGRWRGDTGPKWSPQTTEMAPFPLAVAKNPRPALCLFQHNPCRQGQELFFFLPLPILRRLFQLRMFEPLIAQEVAILGL